uniref:Uncharacterized protein n=1 Tax=Anguilla anguilla TaxID=7936 RepID=A0A0E9Q222_ANGAN
MELWNYLVVF